MTALLLSVGAAWAGPIEDGDAAYKRGDYAEAVKQYRLAAEEGNTKGQLGLGLLYKYGKGVKQDYREALKWIRLAAAQGYWAAQSSLCVMYHSGVGVPKDDVRAHMWCSSAKASPGCGLCAAGGLRDELAKLMTPQQIADAQKLARDCQQRNFKDCD